MGGMSKGGQSDMGGMSKGGWQSQIDTGARVGQFDENQDTTGLSHYTQPSDEENFPSADSVSLAPDNSKSTTTNLANQIANSLSQKITQEVSAQLAAQAVAAPPPAATTVIGQNGNVASGNTDSGNMIGQNGNVASGNSDSGNTGSVIGQNGNVATIGNTVNSNSGNTMTVNHFHSTSPGFKDEQLIETDTAAVDEAERSDLAATTNGFVDNNKEGEEIMGEAGGLEEVDDQGNMKAIYIVDGDEIFDNGAPPIEPGTPVFKTTTHASSSPILLWPKGDFRYLLEDDITGVVKIDVMNALDYLNFHLNGCVTFQPLTDSWTGNYFKIRAAKKGCYANIGYSKSSVRNLNLDSGCAFGTILHELMHIMGDIHQHERADRDQYVTVVTSNIDSSKLSQFDKMSNTGNPIEGASAIYDLDSVMHYPKDAFANPKATKNKMSTVQTKDASKASVIGQRIQASSSDIQKLRAAYSCTNTAKPSGWNAPHAKPVGFSSYRSPRSAAAVLRMDGQSWTDGERSVTIDICNKDGSPGKTVKTKLGPNFSISTPLYCKGPAADMYFFCKNNADCPTDIGSQTCGDYTTNKKGQQVGRCQGIPFLNNIKLCYEQDPCRNGGTCTDLVADYECKCDPAFMGKNCEIKV